MQGTDRRGYTVDEAARMLQFHPDALRYWLRVGELNGVRLGRRDEWLIGPDALTLFLRQNGEVAPADYRLAS